MTDEEKTMLKGLIAKKIISTEEDIRDYKELTAPVAPDVAIGRISRMDAINNKSVMEAALREAESRLHGLKKALENIDHSNFGLCRICKTAIPIQRLRIMPYIDKCVKCS